MDLRKRECCSGVVMAALDHREGKGCVSIDLHGRGDGVGSQRRRWWWCGGRQRLEEKAGVVQGLEKEKEVGGCASWVERSGGGGVEETTK